MGDNKLLSSPQLKLFETFNDDHFWVGGTISFYITLDIEGALAEGVVIVADGSAIADSLIGKEGRHIVGATLLKAGEEYNYLSQTQFSTGTNASWSAVIKDRDLNLTAKMPLQLRVYVNRFDALKAGIGTIRMSISPLENPDGGCAHEIAVDIHTAGEQASDGQRKNKLKSLARKLLKGDAKLTEMFADENEKKRALAFYKVTEQEVEQELHRLREGKDVIPRIR